MAPGTGGLSPDKSDNRKLTHYQFLALNLTVAAVRVAEAVPSGSTSTDAYRGRLPASPLFLDPAIGAADGAPALRAVHEEKGLSIPACCPKKMSPITGQPVTAFLAARHCPPLPVLPVLRIKNFTCPCSDL
jgi:hypothetical protein